MADDPATNQDVQLYWDWGTAYDFMISLWVLHEPAEFGLRPAWAAGMRSRLPAEERETLEQFECCGISSPFHWIYRLPDPKDGRSLLQALARLPPEERLPALSLSPELLGEAEAILRSVAEKGAWEEKDLQDLRAQEVFHKHGKAATDMLEKALDLWSRVAESGERLLQAFQAYHDGFFAEEENRIRPALRESLERAQQLAQDLPLADLVEELSQGVRIEETFDSPELVLAPSYWGTPLLIFGKVSATRQIMVFGARPAEASLVPGEVVPDALVRTLKALSDPTRLRILRYLSSEPLTPTQLASRLRLRASTVVHHLNTLRLATLVQVKLGPGKEKRYAARADNTAAAFASLEDFLGQGELDVGEEEALTLEAAP